MSYEEMKDKFLSMAQEEKRKVYRCKEGYNSLDDVQTWAACWKENRDRLLAQYEDWQRTGYLESTEPGKKAVLKGEKKTTKIGKTKPLTIYLPKVQGKTGTVKKEVNQTLAAKISVWKGDITTLEIDAIVNAANTKLAGGGGVDGAIHRGAGKFLRDECATLGGCPTGKAKITGGYMLPAKYVIHAVGPRGEKPELLKSCYNSCLDLMLEKNLRSVAFPCISTGVYGYPQEAAAKVALHTIRNFLDKNQDAIDRIIFCVFLPSDATVYENLLQLYFPVE